MSARFWQVWGKLLILSQILREIGPLTAVRCPVPHVWPILADVGPRRFVADR